MFFRVELLFIFLMYLGPARADKVLPCKEIQVSTKDIVSKIKDLQKKDDDRLSYDLAQAYMVGAVYDEYVICAARDIKKGQEWGWFKIPRRGEIRGVIHWDGKIKNRRYLEKAKPILETLVSKGVSQWWGFYLKLQLAWLNEKQGKLDLASKLYLDFFQEGARKVEKSFICKLEPCEVLTATLESLMFLKRVYEEQGKPEKVKEMDALLEEYKGKVVGPNDFPEEFFRYMHKDDPEKLKKLDEFMKKHDVSK